MITQPSSGNGFFSELDHRKRGIDANDGAGGECSDQPDRNIRYNIVAGDSANKENGGFREGEAAVLWTAQSCGLS